MNDQKVYDGATYVAASRFFIYKKGNISLAGMQKIIYNPSRVKNSYGECTTKIIYPTLKTLANSFPLSMFPKHICLPSEVMVSGSYEKLKENIEGIALAKERLFAECNRQVRLIYGVLFGHTTDSFDWNCLHVDKEFDLSMDGKNLDGQMRIFQPVCLCGKKEMFGYGLLFKGETNRAKLSGRVEYRNTSDDGAIATEQVAWPPKPEYLLGVENNSSEPEPKTEPFKNVPIPISSGDDVELVGVLAVAGKSVDFIHPKELCAIVAFDRNTIKYKRFDSMQRIYLRTSHRAMYMARYQNNERSYWAVPIKNILPIMNKVEIPED